MYSWTVSSHESGIKLIDFLKSKLGSEFTARHLKRALETNLCKVNGRFERFGTAVLGHGDQVFLHENVGIQHQRKPAKIEYLYEDSHFFALDKPAGLSFDSLILMKQLKEERHFVQPVHRLDKETSGAILYAKTSEAAKALLQLFKDRAIEKRYLAIADGIPKNSYGVVENYMGKLKTYEGQALWGEVPKDKGVLAVTQWKIEKKGASSSLILCQPLTGRTHQIRVHLSGMGHPILGDKQYGKTFRSNFFPKRCLLHAYQLLFKHPFEDKQLIIESPLPEDFLGALAELKLL